MGTSILHIKTYKTFSFLILQTLSTFNFLLSTYAQTPQPFPTEHLQLWLRADSIENTDGKVSQWYDLGPNNYVIRQTNANARPTVKGDAINGKPALLFDGTKTYLTGGDILDLGSNSWIWFVVGKSNINENNRPFFAKSLYGSEVGRYNLSTRRLFYVTTNNETYNVNIPTTAIQPSHWLMLTWENDRTILQNKIYVNGSLLCNSSFPNYDMQNSRSFLIGANNGTNGTTPNTNYYLNGEIAEIIAIDTIDSNTLNLIHEYLYNKYSRIVSLGPDIHIPYGFCDTVITTAYNHDFVSYQWSNGETDSIIHINRSGHYSVTVTNNFGVTSSDDINVYIPEVFQMYDTTICAGDTTYWNTRLSSEDYSYQWFKDGEEYADVIDQIKIFEGGAYNCIITDSLGCIFQTDTIRLYIDNYPISTSFDVTHFATTDTSLCSGNTIGIATNSNETTSYIWNTGSTASRITLTQSGEYSLTTTNTRGCRAENTINVTILGNAPEINYTIDNLCFKDSTSFVGNSYSEQGIESYLWIIDDTDSIAEQSFNYSFAHTGNHNVRTIVTSNNTCRADSSFTIKIKELPEPNFTYTPVCTGIPMNFIGDSNIPEGTSVESYIWIINDSIIGTNENLTFSTDNAGIVSLTYALSISNGCQADTTISIPVNNDYAEPRYVYPAYPTNGTLVSSDSISFLWNYDYDILYYNLITSPSADFTNADTIACSTNRITLPSETFTDTTYWKITAYNHCLVSFESEPYFFRQTTNGNLSISSYDNLQLWLRADSVELTNNKVSRWYDLSNNNHLIQQTNANASPTINVTAINNKPTIQFNGSSSYLTGGNILNLGYNSWTWFVIGKNNINENNRPYFAKSLYGSEVGRYNLSTKRLYYVTTDNETYNVNIPATAIQESSWHILIWENDREFLMNKIYVNGTLYGSSYFPNYDMQNTRSFLIGANNGTNGTIPNANFYLDGEIAEIIALNTVDSTLRNQVYDYLYGKYIATVSLGLDIHVPYGFCDTAITTAYNPDFTSYLWSTGETDSVIHVNHTSRYTVTVTNSFGVTSTDDIKVYFPEVLQMQDTTICMGDTIRWDLKLSPNDYSYQWFKDGEQYNNANHDISLFEEGAYNCIITDSLGCSFQTNTMHLAIDNYTNTTGFNNTDTTLCYGNRIHIVSNYEETASAIWQDGNTNLEYYLSQPGTYTVTTTNNRGCQAINTINVNLQGQVPMPNFSIEGHCQNIPIYIIDLSTSEIGDISTHRWFANDSLIGTDEYASHTFTEYGQQNIKLYLETTDNCANDTTISVYIDPQPQPDFTPKFFCQNALTEIHTQSSIAEGNVTAHSWIINGEPQNGDSITAMFSNNGINTLTLSAESELGCVSTKTFEINVQQADMPRIGISGVCVGHETEFINETPFNNINPQTAWEWNFGDESESSTSRNTVHTYDSIGTYDISLTVTYANRCTTSIDTTITIHELPDASISTHNGCIGAETILESEISSTDNIVDYNWQIDSIFISREAQPTFVADTIGTFAVSLDIKTEHACSSQTTDSITIYENPNIMFTQSRNWGGNPLFVEFENMSNGATSYHWDFGGMGESTQPNPYFIFTEPGTYEVTLIGTNEHGCMARYTAGTITVVEPIVDIMLMDLKVTIENSFAKISFVIVNLGTLPVEDLVLELKINDRTFRESIDYIAQGEVRPYTFGTQMPVPQSNDIKSTICVEAIVPDYEGHSDTNLTNNILCITDAENLSVGVPYPIPASEQITCDIYTKIPTDLDISIFSIYGKMVKHNTISQHKGYLKYEANVSELSAGMYFIRVNSKDESITHKFEIR